jgi:hypothetical protein
MQDQLTLQGCRSTAYGEVTSVTLVATREDLSRWTRAHADVSGIRWSVEPGPGGTMLIVEHAHDRAAAARLGAVALGAAGGTSAGQAA